MDEGKRLKKSDRTRAAIIDAARRLFAEAGYDRTSIRDIAAVAGADPALVIRYFGSKDQLFAQAAEITLRLPDLSAVPAAEIGLISPDISSPSGREAPAAAASPSFFAPPRRTRRRPRRSGRFSRPRFFRWCEAWVSQKARTNAQR